MCSPLVHEFQRAGPQPGGFLPRYVRTPWNQWERLFPNHCPHWDWQPPNTYLRESGRNSGLTKGRGAGRKEDNLKLKSLYPWHSQRAIVVHFRVRMGLGTRLWHWSPECTFASRNPNTRRSEIQQAPQKCYFHQPKINRKICPDAVRHSETFYLKQLCKTHLTFSVKDVSHLSIHHCTDSWSLVPPLSL